MSTRLKEDKNEEKKSKKGDNSKNEDNNHNIYNYTLTGTYTKGSSKNVKLL